MELYYGMGAIIGVCMLVLLIGTIKQKSGKIAVFVLRCAGGAVGICVINSILESQGIAVAAGINPVSILTTGALGISGLALIYGILLYRFL